MKQGIAFLVAIFLGANTFAQSLSTKIHNPYSSMRALGMGNAFTAVADDYSLILYNPAGFARKKHNEIQITLAGAGVSQKTLTVADDIKKAADTPGTDSEKAQAVSDELEKYYGESLGGKVQALEMFWVNQGWGVALVPADLTIDMTINRQVGPALDLNVKGDSILALGFGKSFGKEFDAGLTAKYIHRVSIEEVLPAFELATDSNVLSTKRFREGTKFDFDLGFMWTPGWFSSSTKKVRTVVPKTKTSKPPVPPPTPVAAPAAPALAPAAPPTPPPQAPAAAVAEEPYLEEPPLREDITETPVEAPAPEIEATPSDSGTRTPQQASNEVDPAAPSTQPVAPHVWDAPPGATPVPVPPPSEVSPLTESEAQQIEEKTAAPVSPARPVSDVPDDATVEVIGADAEEEPQYVENTVEVPNTNRQPLSFGFVVHNVIGGEFSQSKIVNKDATMLPAKIDRTFDVGMQYKLYNGEDFVIRYMLDFRNMGYKGATTFNKIVHTGIEFDYSPSTWFKTQLRAGLNQTYFTAGASFLFGILNIDVVTYGEEVGTLDEKRESRVTAAKVGFNF